MKDPVVEGEVTVGDPTLHRDLRDTLDQGMNRGVGLVKGEDRGLTVREIVNNENHFLITIEGVGDPKGVETAVEDQVEIRKLIKFVGIAKNEVICVEIVGQGDPHINNSSRILRQDRARVQSIMYRVPQFKVA